MLAQGVWRLARIVEVMGSGVRHAAAVIEPYALTFTDESDAVKARLAQVKKATRCARL
jgi:hypothetical protein